ncbi:BofC N-terminal domain-containing protein [Alteribacillus bidgolensis]|uniref:Bypass of Forespore C, N terminal n=1 Tax=Alteribacillus bidgolensis TaxID=930129 RepID=A0A1G8N6L7_9BACI|nr:BofC N-terminal domain-containing protein [Alteribacillus bidgolensis]SDI75773.1 Bypass of Forespore C, N terminal [Alteribacillus bidgolensis]
MLISVTRYVVTIFLTGTILFSPQAEAEMDNYHPRYPAIYEVILEKETSNGLVVTEKKYETVWAVEDFWSKYQNWELIDQKQDQIILRKPYEKH